MKVIIKLLILFIFFSSCVVEEKKSEFIAELRSKQSDLSFTFIANFSNYFIILEKEPEEEYCSKIDTVDTQKIINIFNEFKLLNRNYAFFDNSIDDASNQKLVESRKLLIIVNLGSSDLIITIPTVELAEKLLKRIGKELNYSDCFLELSNDLK